jgi:rubrerythrin
LKEVAKEFPVAKDLTFVFQCIDAIEISLSIEREGLAFYEKAARNVSDPKVKLMFLRLAEEEKTHIQILKDKALFLQPAISPGKSINKKLLVDFIKETIKEKIFPTFELKVVNKFKNDIEALDYGIKAEKRSIKILNQLLADEKKLDVRAIFLHLMVDEKKHLTLLEDLKKTV